MNPKLALICLRNEILPNWKEFVRYCFVTEGSNMVFILTVADHRFPTIHKAGLRKSSSRVKSSSPEEIFGELIKDFLCFMRGSHHIGYTMRATHSIKHVGLRPISPKFFPFLLLLTRLDGDFMPWPSEL